MNAVIYARVEQHEKSNERRAARITDCRKWAQQHRYHVERIFTDESSIGSKLDRPGFTAMCEFVLQRKHCDIIIAEHTQLLTHCRDCERVADFFDELGVRIYSLADGIITPYRLLNSPKRKPVRRNTARSGMMVA